PPGSFVNTELAFRTVPEYDLRVADVAFIPAERWANIDLEDNLRGAPDLVIEVLSPFNTAREMYEKEQLSMAMDVRSFGLLIQMSAMCVWRVQMDQRRPTMWVSIFHRNFLGCFVVR